MTYNNQPICNKCAKKIISDRLKTSNNDIATTSIFKLFLNKTKVLEEILDFITFYNEDKTLMLYDSFGTTETTNEKVSLDDIDIPQVIKTILSKRIKHLLPVQIEAINNGLLHNQNMLVVSKTASGKTLIGELAGITKTLQNKKMIYLSPLVALANQKYRDFKNQYKDLGLNITIKVGSNRIKAEDELFIKEKSIIDSDIIIATYEGLDFILRNGESNHLNDLGVVIIDEIHMLENNERGSRLNGLIKRLMKLYPQAQIIALSATVKNSREIAGEFNLKLVEYDKRPVKLERYIDFMNNEDEKSKKIIQLCKDEFKQISSKGYHGQTMIFTDSRRKKDLIAKNLNKNGIKSEAYHAGLSYKRKVEIERAYLKQEITTVVTTSALASGVDFPSSQVIFESLRMGIKFLSNNEFHQMLGRAGRPTFHDIGKVFLLPIIGNTFNQENEVSVALSLLENDVDEVKIYYDKKATFEQILSDICAFKKISYFELEKKYNQIDNPLTFQNAIEVLIDHNMIYRNEEYFLTPTRYGKAVAISFIDIYTAEIIRENIYDNPLDIVLDIEKFENVYLSNRFIKAFERNMDFYISSKLFSSSVKRILFSGDYIGILNSNLENKLVNVEKDFMLCDCLTLYCGCLERNVSNHIIERRLQGWSPKQISNEFMNNYELNLYSGDIYNWLDQVIRILEAIKRIAKSQNFNRVYRNCKEIIQKIEG